jgi:hypothetical protein
MSVTLSLSADTAAPGSSVTATVYVSARQAIAHHTMVALSASKGTASLSTGKLGDVGSGGCATFGTVKIPSSLGSGAVTLTASVTADQAGKRTVARTITVSAQTAVSSNSPTSNLVPTLPMTVNGELRQVPSNLSAPQVALPPIAPPIIAAATLDLGSSTVLRSNDSSLGSESAFRRLAEIQVAWLTTLLVGFALLLTQFRLQYRRPRPSTPMPAKPSRRRQRPKA